MGLTPEEKVDARTALAESKQSKKEHEQREARRVSNWQHQNEADHLAQVVIPNLAHEVAKRISERDLDAEHGVVITYRESLHTRFGRRNPPIRILAWLITVQLDTTENLSFINLTRTGLIVGFHNNQRFVPVDLTKLPYTDLKELESELNDLEHHVFILEEIDTNIDRMSQPPSE